MYMGNRTLRKAGEQFKYTEDQIQEYIKCKKDIIYFAEKYFYIVTIDRGKHLIELYDFQKKILKACLETPEEKQHIICKIARQYGKTTIFSIFMLHYILFNKDKFVAVLAHQEKLAIEILDRIKFGFKNLPLWLQVGVIDGGWNQKSITLENGSKVYAFATGSESVTGFTVNLLYLDEFAKVPPHVAEEFIASTYPVISSGKTSKIIMVSTPKGMNHFYEFWSSAMRRKNNFYPIRVGWWEIPGRDEEWKRKTISDIGQKRFDQEYSCKFLGSSSTLIDSDILERIDPKQPVTTKWTNLFLIYELPVKEALYILGIDCAKGTKNDYSVIQVLRIYNEHEIKQVAVYRNNDIAPHDFSQICISISDYYNEAQMMIENNDIGQSLCDTIWYEYECDRIVNVDPKGLGIRSTRKTKLKANVNLKEYMEREWLEIVDQQTVYELSRYEEVRPNVFKCGNQENDDTVTSMLWALYFVITDYYEGKSTDIRKIDDKYKVENADDEDDEDGPVFIFE